MMKCVIIDDEPLAARIISSYINKTAGLELSRSFENAFEALYYIQTRSIDIVFLDIQMPGINGIQFIKILKYRPSIIVTTAYREYALEALEVGVADYLLKPITYERFLQAISKVMDAPKASSGLDAIPIATETRPAYVYIKSDNAHNQLMLKDIHYIKGEKSYSRILTTGKEYIVSGNLALYAMKLPPPQFMRIHKSYLIATERIERFNGAHVWIEGTKIPIGRTYKQQLLQHLQPLTW